MANTIVFITNQRSIDHLIEVVLIKIVDVSNLIIRMFMYSAMKIRANIPLLYSVLNPDTSSDSPSAKSNGVRFVSATFVMNQITVIGRIIAMIGVFIFIDIRFMSIR